MFCHSQTMGFNSGEPGSVPGWGWQRSLTHYAARDPRVLSQQFGGRLRFSARFYFNSPVLSTATVCHPQPQRANLSHSKLSIASVSHPSHSELILAFKGTSCSLDLQRCLQSVLTGSSLICSCLKVISNAGFFLISILGGSLLSPDSVQSLPLHSSFCAIYYSFPWVVGFVVCLLFLSPAHSFQQWVKVPLEKHQNLLPYMIIVRAKCPRSNQGVIILLINIQY